MQEKTEVRLRCLSIAGLLLGEDFVMADANNVKALAKEFEAWVLREKSTKPNLVQPHQTPGGGQH